MLLGTLQLETQAKRDRNLTSSTSASHRDCSYLRRAKLHKCQISVLQSTWNVQVCSDAIPEVGIYLLDRFSGRPLQRCPGFRTQLLGEILNRPWLWKGSINSFTPDRYLKHSPGKSNTKFPFPFSQVSTVSWMEMTPILQLPIKILTTALSLKGACINCFQIQSYLWGKGLNTPKIQKKNEKWWKIVDKSSSIKRC